MSSLDRVLEPETQFIAIDVYGEMEKLSLRGHVVVGSFFLGSMFSADQGVVSRLAVLCSRE